MYSSSGPNAPGLNAPNRRTKSPFSTKLQIPNTFLIIIIICCENGISHVCHLRLSTCWSSQHFSLWPAFHMSLNRLDRSQRKLWSYDVSKSNHSNIINDFSCRKWLCECRGKHKCAMNYILTHVGRKNCQYVSLCYRPFSAWNSSARALLLFIIDFNVLFL